MGSWDNGFFSQNLTYLLQTKPRGEQSIIASNAGIDPSQFSLIKKGKANLYLDKAMKICEAFNETLQDMVYVDLQARDKRLKGELTAKIRIQKRKISSNEELMGVRPNLVGDNTFRRFEGKKYFVYYLSGIEELHMREGTLELFHRRENSKVVPGILKTESQKYNIKLVIEHPTYIYVFGNNRNYSERLALMLHEPKPREDAKTYVGGIGIVLMEGSSGLPCAQRMALSLYQLPESKVTPYLDIGNTIGHINITLLENQNFYNIIMENRIV